MKTFLSAVLLLCSCLCYSQTNVAKDTLVWSDGTIYTGKVILEEKGKVEFKTEDGVTHTIASSSIARLKQANVQDNKLPPSERRSSSSRSSASNDDESINWSDPAIPHRVLVKHRTGVGLTATGTILTLTGLGLIIGGASQATTYSNSSPTGSSAGVRFGPIPSIGILLSIVGLPMMISGAVKLGRSKKMARSAIIHLR
jgi:hypothetical protein